MTAGVFKIKAGLCLVDVNDFSAHREYEECFGKQSLMVRFINVDIQ